MKKDERVIIRSLKFPADKEYVQYIVGDSGSFDKEYDGNILDPVIETSSNSLCDGKLICIQPKRIILSDRKKVYADNTSLPRLTSIDIIGFFTDVDEDGSENILAVTSEEEAEFFKLLPDDAALTWQWDPSFCHYFQICKSDIDILMIPGIARSKE